MNSPSKTAGYVVGAFFCIALIGWFGFNHFLDTRDDNLPLRVKQVLVNFQKSLPMEIEQGVFLQEFGVSRSEVNFVVKVLSLKSSDVGQKEIRRRFLAVSSLLLCKLRKDLSFPKNLLITMKILDGAGYERFSSENTHSDCNSSSVLQPDKQLL